MVRLSSTTNPFKENTDIMRQRIIITLALVVLGLALAAGALGAPLTTTATITGTAGISLNLPANPSITDTLDGTDQTVNYAPLLGVVDARGSGAGWNLQVSATTFSDGSGHTLAPGTVTSAAQACVAGSTCTAAVNSGITLPLTITTTAAKFFNAAALSGLGKVNVTPTIAVAIPGNAYAGTYTSTVTLAATTGP
jgi:WxL domain surface cell wall-binding